jgi:hypothetical protein
MYRILRKLFSLVRNITNTISNELQIVNYIKLTNK